MDAVDFVSGDESTPAIRMAPAINVNGNTAVPTLAKQLIDILEKKQTRRKSGTLERKEKNNNNVALNLYRKIHQIPNQYYFLYNYLFLRYEGKDEFGRYISDLRFWELQIHNEFSNDTEQNYEISKCWRLHLGSTELLRHVVMVSDSEGAQTWISKKWRALRDFARKQKKCILDSCSKPCGEVGLKLYEQFLKFFYSIYPFIYSTLLCFEVVKNISFACFLFFSLRDMQNASTDILVTSDINFGIILFCFLVSGMILSQMMFVFLSYQHHYNILENTPLLKISSEVGKRAYRIISSMIPFSCIMPAFVLGNLIRYQQKEHTKQREFQFQDEGRPLSKNDEDAEVTNSLPNNVKREESNDLLQNQEVAPDVKSLSMENNNQSLYDEIEKFQKKKKISGQIYSQYRVSVAVLESYVVIIVLLMIMMSMNQGSGSLSDSIEGKVLPFLNIFRQEDQAELSFIGLLHLSKQLVFASFVLYSFIMILTALVQYVDVHKDEQLSIKGQTCLLAYFACHVITRITATVAIFAKPVELERPEDSPVVPHIAAGIIGIILFIGQIVLIYWYKYRRISSFRKASLSEQIIHVLTNTLVVIPFRSGIRYDDTKETERKDESSNEECKPDSTGEFGVDINDTGDSIDYKVTLERELDDLETTVQSLWWEDPKRELTVTDITAIIEKEENDTEEKVKLAQKIHTYLACNGYINKKLHNPRQTKQEYVWLISIHLLVNFFSLSIEFLNGGISTEKGIYVSWDIRIGSFLLGLFFLRLYYNTINIIKSKRPSTPFLSRLKNIGVILCCKEKPYVTKAVPYNLTISKVLELDEVDGARIDLLPGKITLETQTSVTINIKKEDLAKLAYIDESHDGIIQFKKLLGEKPSSPTNT